MPRKLVAYHRRTTKVSSPTSSALRSHAGAEPPRRALSRPEPLSWQPASVFEGGGSSSLASSFMWNRQLVVVAYSLGWRAKSFERWNCAWGQRGRWTAMQKRCTPERIDRARGYRAHLTTPSMQCLRRKGSNQAGSRFLKTQPKSTGKARGINSKA